MKTLISWSSGKDAAWALHVLHQNPAVEVAGLLVTVNEAFDRVAMHGVRRKLVEKQAEAVGLPIFPVEIPHACSNEIYEHRMAAATVKARKAGIEAIAFGDLHLEDVRDYRVSSLAGTGIVPLFPLWGRETGKLAREMIASGVAAVTVCVDPRRLPSTASGKMFDANFLTGLPTDVDACGENGEFHTFVADGPMFRKSISFKIGDTIERDGFVFTDLLGSDTCSEIA